MKCEQCEEMANIVFKITHFYRAAWNADAV